MRRVNLPEWAVTGVHPDYPPEQYLVAVGMARNGRDALRYAEERLETEITAWPLKQHADLLRNTQFAQMITAPAAWIGLSELGESVKRDHATTGFDNVVLCAIRRDDLRLWAAGLLPRARKELRESAQPPSAGTVQKRIELVGAYFLKAARVVALGLIVNGKLEQSAFEEAEHGAQRLWELPSLMRVNQVGSGSKAQIRGGVPGELVLFARFRGEAPGSVPLRWQFAPNLRGALNGDEVFNVAGEARCTVLQVAPNGDESGQVFASLDVDQVLGRRTGIQMPSWYWSINLPARDNGEIVLDVKETGSGAGKEVKPQFVTELTTWCGLRGLKVSTGKPTTEKPYKLKLSGTLEVHSSAKDGRASAYTSGQVTLVDLETGNVLYTYTPGIQRNGEENASEINVALSTQRDMTAEALIEFAGRLTALLPAPEDNELRK
jgi:hypothetical protein